jgi:hypothetical protein
VSEAASRSAQEAGRVELGVALDVVVLVRLEALAELVGVVVEDEALGDGEVVGTLVALVVPDGRPPPVQAAASSATASADAPSTRGGRWRGERKEAFPGLVVAGISSNLSRLPAGTEPVGSRAWQPAPDPWSSMSTPASTTPAPSSSRPGTPASTCGR